MVCSRRCIVVTIDGASYDVDVDVENIYKIYHSSTSNRQVSPGGGEGVFS
jgi:hypothetical protein